MMHWPTWLWGGICAAPILPYLFEAIFDTRGNNPRQKRKATMKASFPYLRDSNKIASHRKQNKQNQKESSR